MSWISYMCDSWYGLFVFRVKNQEKENLID
jgi:hypothetical protein